MNTARILIVEDNDDNALICITALTHFGFQAVRAADGAAGLRLARELSPDLILLDLSLPVLSGWDVAERLRGDSETEGIPIVVWSAHDSPADRLRAETLGCVGYLAKPCEIRPLLREVERALSCVPASAGASMEEAEGAEARIPRRAMGWAAAAMVSMMVVTAHLRWGSRRGRRGTAPLRQAVGMV